MSVSESASDTDSDTNSVPVHLGCPREKVKTVIECFFLLHDFKSRGHPTFTSSAHIETWRSSMVEIRVRTLAERSEGK